MRLGAQRKISGVPPPFNKNSYRSQGYKDNTRSSSAKMCHSMKLDLKRHAPGPYKTNLDDSQKAMFHDLERSLSERCRRPLAIVPGSGLFGGYTPGGEDIYFFCALLFAHLARAAAAIRARPVAEMRRFGVLLELPTDSAFRFAQRAF